MQLIKTEIYKLDCFTFKDVHINVPSAVVEGHKAVLTCTFDLETDQLYSVKWYRGAGEFYRYTPSDEKPIKQFKIKGFHVVESESNETQVVLEQVSRAISGPFSCEVTADQPSFFTDMKTADLEVVSLPKKDPYITGLRTRYKLGDVLRTNCTSEKSSPAANLAWYVNGQHVEAPHVHRHVYEDGDYVT
ncbi:hypothetical protein NQ315_003008 [Exocentrus adspersus]|uniref:Ig-like domain-containing protein n=1 Tax=Exocentrus adspersus TaxID=1586481 RepID=A0AAV8W474_9CUCU|nr:hypothetical protein NQ315_003008 [Exocentrus adspersus]